MGVAFSVANVLQLLTFTGGECPFWGRTFDSFVETSSDPTTGDTYRFISVSSFRGLARFKNTLITDPLLIRDEYERLYNFCSQESSELPFKGSGHGVAVIGHPGIGQSLHCASPEDCLMVMYRQVTVSVVCALSPRVRSKAHRVSIRAEPDLDFQRHGGPSPYSGVGSILGRSSGRRLGIERFECIAQGTISIYGE